MKNPELFKRTTDILFDAYFNDTLQHGNCAACAVGNMIASNIGLKYKAHIDSNALMWDGLFPNWDMVFSTYNHKQLIREHNYSNEAKAQIDCTGYKWQELAKIEYAFETASKGNSNEDWMYNGLVAVLEVLKEIHEATDDDLLPERIRFNNHYQTLSL